MYHYVRPLADSAFPNLKALELSAFLSQLEYLQKHYVILSISEFSAALADKTPFPERACLLTFDDGYSDHYRYVFPHLVDRGLEGLFFAPKSSLIDRRMLEVNRIQFTLASHCNPNEMADEIDNLIAARGVDPGPLREQYFVPNRFDCAEVAYVKRLLQNVLPASFRSDLTAALFGRHVTADEASFVNDLYLSADQAREMRAQGMEFGGHGDLHLWHGLSSSEELFQEVSGSVQALEEIGAPVEAGFYCYPYGSVTQTVRDVVASAGFKAAFTVEPIIWNTGGDSLNISRLDTNDLPVQAGLNKA
jgi:peptidoglycan/xylan/chitin deacetylase (PgdA/CDA1 family)